MLTTGNFRDWHTVVRQILWRLVLETSGCVHCCVVCLKILTLKDDVSEELPEDRQGKMLIHTEYSLLSMLQDQDGVIHHHGLFQVISLTVILLW